MKSQQSSRSRRIWLMFDKLGALGVILSAVASPCCFPLFATIGGALGLGSVPFLRGNASVLIQAMTALAFLGHIAAYRQHRKRGPLLTSTVSVGLVLVAYFLTYHVVLIYAALVGLTIAAVWNLVISRRARACCSAADAEDRARETERK